MTTMLATTRASSLPWLSDGPRAIPQAFPYQGSKRALAGLILSLFPEEGVGRLVEPFAGSAAVCVAARKYDMAETCFISDVNAPLMGLWRQILCAPQELSNRYERMWLDQQSDPRKYYVRVRDEFNRTQAPELLLYLLCRCVKAAVRYNQRTGDFNQGADNRRLGARPDVVRERLTAVSHLLQGSSVRVADYQTVLA
ncbi:MAG: DNA adenine methylase [Propionibacteriaceae bacterium]|nr:DNA adenine methylase [Propionibacteriaceae bacterium]